MTDSKKSNVYTRAGDKGQTGLVSGSRVSKGATRIDCYGEIDELNSFLGMVISLMDKKATYQYIRTYLIDIQKRLFDLGSNMACESEKIEQYKLPQIKDEYIKEMESKIDSMDKELPPLKNFILPGGTYAASYLHICRTICRRAERHMVRFHDETGESLPANALEFINRLSDYFFVLARYVNYLERKYDTVWKP